MAHPPHTLKEYVQVSLPSPSESDGGGDVHSDVNDGVGDDDRTDEAELRAEPSDEPPEGDLL